MSIRDVYAMFCYGVLIDNDLVPDYLIKKYPQYNLATQNVGDVYQDDREYTLLYIKGTEKIVGSRTGTFVEHITIKNSSEKIVIEEFVLTWTLVMWGPL